MQEAINDLNKKIEAANKKLEPKIDYDSKSLTEICSEADLNQSRANKQFRGKWIELTGTISDNLSESYLGSNSILVKSSNVYIHLDSQGVNTNNLNNRQDIAFKGRIQRVSTDFIGCSISLSNVSILDSK